jgi:hypothetical protein
MYNLAIPAFAFFAAPGDVRRSHTASASLWACRVIFAVMGKMRKPALSASLQM